jgi:hypothetical protein
MFWHTRHSLRAESNIVGAIAGGTLVLAVLLGLIADGQLQNTNQTLAQAANAIVYSEAQQGCWTNTTSTIVQQILQSGGLSSPSVMITHENTTTANFGNPVQVTLQYPVHLALFGIGLPITLWAHAQFQSASFYVPVALNQPNSQCSTPNF